jgi:hypothetical protein
MNCFACHGGEHNGVSVPGVPNRNYLLETLTSDVRQVKLQLGRPLGHMDVGSLFMPLGGDRGTTNAVMFGVALLAFRDPDLSLLGARIPPRMTHHDMDAPAWWHFKKKSRLYIDGFAVKAPRPLMQFLLVEQNGPEQFLEWEPDFEHVFAYLMSLEPPRPTLAFDQDLAAVGKELFGRHCAECHGHYGVGEDYPERLIPWDEIRTDPVRLRALTPEHRGRYAESWFAHSNRDQIDLDPGGYIAPPLDGISASAPYLHNGSVPTLWHLLHPRNRPQVWRRRGKAYDADRVGLAVEEWSRLPEEGRDADQRHEYFDTQGFGKSAQGHDYPERLSESERTAVLEYLKTL